MIALELLGFFWVCMKPSFMDPANDEEDMMGNKNYS